jgi:hypothetical protein
VLILAALLVPQYSDYGARSRGEETLLSLMPVQERVAANIVSLGTVEGAGHGLGQVQGTSLGELTVLEDGIIIALASEDGQIFVLVPTLSANGVAWRCLGGSRKDVPRKCRGKI